jgi:hypothetical protein
MLLSIQYLLIIYYNYLPVGIFQVKVPVLVPDWYMA